MMPTERKSNARLDAPVIEATAAVWLSLRDRGMSPEETGRFVRWLQEDPQNAEIFGELDATWKAFDRLMMVGNAESHPSGGDTIARHSQPHVSPSRKIGGRAALMAAAMIFIALMVSWITLKTRQPTAETSIGGYQRLEMPDGSVAQLNTDTAIRVEFTGTERRVELLRGEAFFEVAKESARPFIVRAHAVAIRAVGTAFNVKQRESAVEVMVSEGRVRVGATARDTDSDIKQHADADIAPPELNAGQRLTVGYGESTGEGAPGSGMIRDISATELRRALAWQERRLEFDATPLAEIVREFNRYNRRQLVLADPGLGAKRFSGTFRADGCETLVRLLETDFAIRVQRERDRIVVGTPK